MKKKMSLTERAYRHLRDDLLTCRLVPGERINIKDVSDSLGFSLGAVREALSRLTSEGFVTQDEARGFRATPISMADLNDLVTVRSEIEGQCLRRAIACGGIDWESAIVSAAHRLSKTPTRDPADPARLNEDYAVPERTRPYLPMIGWSWPRPGDRPILSRPRPPRRPRRTRPCRG